MRIEWSPEAVAFRHRLRSWLDGNLDPQWNSQIETFEDYVRVHRAWDRQLYEAGYAGMWWPKEFGGTDASPEIRAIYAEEMARAGAPDELAGLGRALLAPGIMRFGTEAQKRDLLPPILTGETVWCQGYSEPEAGSDLAGVRTQARAAGDEYIVNGTKIWTSRAHYADRCFMLVRTNPELPKHDGLSMLLVDMASPGIEVRPIHQLNGQSNFNQVFLNDVRVPIRDRLGDEGQGWAVARYILTYERGIRSSVRPAAAMERLLLATHAHAGRTEWFANDFMRSAVEVVAARLLAYKLLASQMGGGEPGMNGSAVKLFWSEAWQRLAERAMLMAGEAALPDYRPEPYTRDMPSEFLDTRQRTIAGGSSEIQRGIIATSLLGLPRH